MRKTADHPTPFPSQILNKLRGLNPYGLPVHDPFAGLGDRLGALCDEMGWDFSGTEIENAFIQDRRVACGDARMISTYPASPYMIMTSVAYPNGVSDHHRSSDASTRHTYRASIANLEGQDRPLDVGNMGRYGYRGRGAKSKARKAYWDIARESVQCWMDTQCEFVALNVKDFVYSKKGQMHVEPVVTDWTNLLLEVGFKVSELIKVPTPGLRDGANHKTRIDHEVIILASR